ncbi:FMN-dependent NADH-azoreductase [Paraurantiacibacter namhicola]|uniref:FMN dependent NADH:quinone oxidoreductase n=1 Tax=Paraurantiacibacter namhicola TaxID=645517 RepID=A0A1C7DA33_9SPHN|nr:FMN-dependent NADH-azoreductase [Paraurantiacibacter namhicola]ANU08346.1 FMN-dependent NADH-azoreductase 1 [Paraurantiacibacter namhicola]
MQILRIDSATTGEQSVSRRLTGLILDHLTAKNPGADVTSRDLSSNPVPHLDPVTTTANRTAPDTHEEAVERAYPEEKAVLDEFLAADTVVIGAPMYNFSVPSNLKAWMDRLAVPGTTFRFSESGPEGLAGNRRIIVASTRGGEYGEDNPMDHQESLLKTFMGFLGIDNVEIIRVEKIGYGPEAIEEGVAAAREQIAKL